MFNTQKSDDQVNTEKYRDSKLHKKIKYKTLRWYRIGSVSADPQNLRYRIGSVLKKLYRCIPTKKCDVFSDRGKKLEGLFRIDKGGGGGRQRS